MDWYYAKNGERQGPISEASLRSMLVTGEIAQTDLVWREGMPDWLPAGEVMGHSGEDSVTSNRPAQQPPGGSQIPQAGIGGTGMSGGTIANEPIPNYFVPSLLVILLCGCVSWPFCIPALVFASKVNGFVAVGDITRAKDASQKARTWMWIGVGVGIVSNSLALAYFLLSPEAMQ